MTTRKDTHKYIVMSGSTTVYVGVTTDLKRRVAEHRRRWPGAKISKVGSATTRSLALEWEAQRAKSFGPSAARSVKDAIVPHRVRSRNGRVR